MEQIIYISTARQPVDQVQIADILAVSRRNNARDGLTGLLIAGGQRFLQVLEGPQLPLARAIERIKRDPRHFAIVELRRAAIAQRAFPAWQMGHAAAAAEAGGTLESLIATLTESVDDESLRAELQGFAAMHSRAA